MALMTTTLIGPDVVYIARDSFPITVLLCLSGTV